MIRQIWLSEDSTEVIMRAAARGYESPYKQERLGILLGYVSGGIVRVERAVVYRAGLRTRTAASIGDSRQFERRVKELQDKTGLGYLGSFHTHNEVAGTNSSALSQADKTPLCDNLTAHIELIAAIRASKSRIRPSRRYLQLSCENYRYRVVGYGCRQDFKCLPVFSDAGRSSRTT